MEPRFTASVIPTRTYVIAPNMERFKGFCARNGIKPYARTTWPVTRSVHLRGCKIRSKDKVYVTYDAAYNTEWLKIVEFMNICTEGWINLEDYNTTYG